jgi:hypothetical protein
MELSYSQLSILIQRFPKFELFYETISHNKVSNLYDVCLAIPVGKKCFVWFTFYKEKNVCYLLTLNKDKKISNCKVMNITFDSSLSLGTILYGTLWEETNNNNILSWFIIEDIFYYQGTLLKIFTFQERLNYLIQFIKKTKQQFDSNQKMVFVLPVLWNIELKSELLEYPKTIPEEGYVIENSKEYKFKINIPYPVHHIQYRSLNNIMPYININNNKKILFNQNNSNSLSNILKKDDFTDYSNRIDYLKPQYKYKTVFQVSADIQQDIYHLFAYGKNNKPVYYGIAYIPSYNKSVFMNSLFRKIRENKNLDFIEESDDEDDFENTNENKYVELDKILFMEFSFHFKFKKWVPLRVVDKNTKVVHIFRLIR